MRRAFSPLLFALCLLLCACAGNEPESVGLPNPWSDHASLHEAEKEAGTELGLPEELGSFKAEVFRTMSGGLLEVIYRASDDVEIRVRKLAGEAQDISGDYSSYTQIHEETIDGAEITIKTQDAATLILVSHGGYSWSVSAQDGFGNDNAGVFIDAILLSALRDSS